MTRSISRQPYAAHPQGHIPGDASRAAMLVALLFDAHVALQRWIYSAISKMVSISTGTSFGSACMPTAERACWPFSPKIS